MLIYGNRMLNEQLISNVIYFLRLPLIVCVVCIHASFSYAIQSKYGIDNKSYDIFEYFIVHIVCQPAVPLFFFFSGFLFFKDDEFYWSIYVNKLFRRMKSLFIPYLFWNLLTILYRCIGELTLPYYFSGKNDMVINWDIFQWLSAFFDFNGGFPISIQFWFVRDLMIIMIFSPIIYYLISKLNIYFLFIIFVFWMFNCHTAVGFSNNCLFFFSLGCFLSIEKINFIEKIDSFCKLIVILYLFLTFIMMYSYIHHYEFHEIQIINQLNKFLGLMIIIYFSSKYIQYGNYYPNKLFINGSFFIFCSHMIFIMPLKRIILNIVHYDNFMCLFLIYTLCVFLTCLLGIYLYKYISKYFPKLTLCIVGR